MSTGRSKQRLLIHACCAPCSTVPLERLDSEYDLAVLFYGPNIHPRGEYQLRLADQRKLCRRLGVELIETDYRPAEWGRSIAPFRNLPEGSQRCQACFRLRMEQTARIADQRNFDLFTVTLTVSRHKNSKVLERIGRQVAEDFRVAYLVVDLKKKNGYNVSVQRSLEFELRRQDYCGCSLSLTEAIQRRRKSGTVER